MDERKNDRLKEEIELAIHRRLNLICNDELTASEILDEAKGATNEILDLIATSITNDVVGEFHEGDHADHSGHNAYWSAFRDGVKEGINYKKRLTETTDSEIDLMNAATDYFLKVNGTIDAPWALDSTGMGVIREMALFGARWQKEHSKTNKQ